MGNIVVIAASTGALEPLRTIVSMLPPLCSASVFVVWHIGNHPSVLPAILSRASKLPARFAQHDSAFEPGHIYVAPPDHHLELTTTRMRLSRGAKVNHLRPAADPLFASAARSFGGKVLGVVLSGKGDDGAAGLAMIKRHGGTTLVQHPDTAESLSMPLAAMMLDQPDEMLLVAEIAERVRSFCLSR